MSYVIFIISFIVQIMKNIRDAAPCGVTSKRINTFAHRSRGLNQLLYIGFNPRTNCTVRRFELYLLMLGLYVNHLMDVRPSADCSCLLFRLSTDCATKNVLICVQKTTGCLEKRILWRPTKELILKADRVTCSVVECPLRVSRTTQCNFLLVLCVYMWV